MFEKILFATYVREMWYLNKVLLCDCAIRIRIRNTYLYVCSIITYYVNEEFGTLTSFLCKKYNNRILFFFYFPSLNIFIPYHQFVILLDNHYIIHFYVYVLLTLKADTLIFLNYFPGIISNIVLIFAKIKYMVKIFPFKLQLILYDCII